MKVIWPYIGNQELALRLAKTIDAKRFPTPTIFFGPRALGKRSAAYWLAAYEYCSEDRRPCGTCASCRMIAAGHHPQVLTIGQSDEPITVAEIRQTFQRFQYVDDRPAWFVLDASEPVSEAVWNTCLKMFEEPPAYLRIVIIASELSSIPATIRSRVAIIRWTRVSDTEMRRAFPTASREDFQEAQGCPGVMTELLVDEQRTTERQRVQSLVQCVIAAQPIPDVEEATEATWTREEIEYRRHLLESLERTDVDQRRLIEIIRRLFTRHQLEHQNVSPPAIYAYTHLA